MTELQNQFTKMKAQKADQPVTHPDNLVKELKAQITELQSHFARLKTPSASKKKTDTPKANNQTKTKPKAPEPTQSTPPVAKNRPKPWYCFQCGEDGHIVSTCSNDPNPPLVAEKRNQLKEKQSRWDKQNHQSQPLN